MLIGLIILLRSNLKRFEKNYMARGLNRLILSLFFMFLGPTIVFSAFKNEGHEFYYFVLILGTIFCLMAVYLLYSGIMTIVKSLSEEENNNFQG